MPEKTLLELLELETKLKKAWLQVKKQREQAQYDAVYHPLKKVPRLDFKGTGIRKVTRNGII